ncbi:toxin-antitoxin system HicB family antitoxin [Acinetobacter variabilis]|uniref:toxin-antitoxin system HicB family antitoxin n=1 Tax=Acinetobacter variabilis TaxID=70346 RepID=UPI0028A872E5|nr:hypothetical protein [Acinetobacter variabilis]
MADERLYIRTTQERRARLELAAMKAGVSVNKYVNDVLEKAEDNNDFRTLVVELLHDINDQLEKKENNESSNINIEILMYLRMLSTPEQRKRVNGELGRLGYYPVRLDNE